jgi:hypothetical protein
MLQKTNRFNRRDFLRTGLVGGPLLTLQYLLAAETQGSTKAPETQKQTARNCIFIFNYGGPSHIDTLDPKPGAPAEIRGEFDTIQTSLPGVHFSEHLPRLAAIADKFTLLRAISHKVLDHRQGGYYTLTGYRPIRRRPPSPEDHPNPGAVLAYLGASDRALPANVTLPNPIHDNFIPTRGVNAGFLGVRYNPFLIDQDPSSADFSVDVLQLPDQLPTKRFRARQSLLANIEPAATSLSAPTNVRTFQTYRQKAFALLNSTAARRAFDVSQEAASHRDRYGRSKYGQSLLLARRLIEAGTRVVTVLGGGPYPMDVWDTHQRNFHRLKNELLPPADQAFSALLVDLEERGLLDETLVVWLGEFGRTPVIGATTVSSMNKADGRDHWPHCYSAILAGGGTRGGTVYGASDQIAAYPRKEQVRPEDVIATVYSALGIDYHAELLDQAGQPFRITTGKPISALF